MERPRLEVADILRRYGAAYRAEREMSLSSAQRRVMRAITACRTAALGGHVEACDSCDHRRIAYNSCRNRHCPKCQSLARAQWIEQRQAELLDCQYFHVVFTLPEKIAAIAFQNKAVVYNLLFAATAETLRTIAADPKHLGAEIGFFAVLHTWGQTLIHHPHLHCVVPGGGLSADRHRWVACRPGFFLPVRVLSRFFRRRFLQLLEQAFDGGQLEFFSSLQALHEREAFRRYLDPLRVKEWVVYAKAPFAGPEQVLDYVGRYTHRVAISNNRLLDIEEGTVTFRWKDYRDDNTLTNDYNGILEQAKNRTDCTAACPLQNNAVYSNTIVQDQTIMPGTAAAGILVQNTYAEKSTVYTKAGNTFGFNPTTKTAAPNTYTLTPSNGEFFIWLEGKVINSVLTYAQWQAAGNN